MHTMALQRQAAQAPAPRQPLPDCNRRCSGAIGASTNPQERRLSD